MLLFPYDAWSNAVLQLETLCRRAAGGQPLVEDAARARRVSARLGAAALLLPLARNRAGGSQRSVDQNRHHHAVCHRQRS